MFGFDILAKSKKSNARAGVLRTAHGTVETPVFMPVGTQASVKAITPRDLNEVGAQIILGNTYHLYLRPGHALVEEAGGLQKFNAWHKPILTDSGGFQVFSLANLNKVTEEGLKFQSHIDGSFHFFTPELVIDIQRSLGSDIMMAFDECSPYPCERDQAFRAHEVTIKWAKRCMSAYQEIAPKHGYEQYLFGIVQGSVYEDIRRQSAAALIDLDFPGYAIGGLSVGEPKSAMYEMTELSAGLLPEDKPRYLMGVGKPEDLVMGVGFGIDMFDCVLPTRNARTGMVFTSEGPLVFRNADCSDDSRPLDPNCDCRVCQRYSRAYIRHLYNQSEITSLILASYHSTYFFQNLMRQIRDSISENCFEEFRKDFLKRYECGGNGK